MNNEQITLVTYCYSKKSGDNGKDAACMKEKQSKFKFFSLIDVCSRLKVIISFSDHLKCKIARKWFI